MGKKEKDNNLNIWYCTQCGKRNAEDDSYCIYCGNPRSQVETKAEAKVVEQDVPDRKSVVEQSKPEKNNKTAIIIVAILCVTVIIGMILYFVVFSDKQQDMQQEPQGEIDTEEIIEEEEADSVVVDDMEYEVGCSYCVLQNLRVREGPGKEYRILSRDELSVDDYEISVDSKTTTDALLEKGQIITCMGMEGDWMRIESGWVCVYDEGERLVG